MICPICFEPFIPNIWNQKYCKYSCKRKAMYEIAKIRGYYTKPHTIKLKSIANSKYYQKKKNDTL
jgi:hypothetical protein